MSEKIVRESQLPPEKKDFLLVAHPKEGAPFPYYVVDANTRGSLTRATMLKGISLPNLERRTRDAILVLMPGHMDRQRQYIGNEEAGDSSDRVAIPYYTLPTPEQSAEFGRRLLELSHACAGLDGTVRARVDEIVAKLQS